MRKILLWASENNWLSKKLPRYGFMKKAVTRFMPGETLDPVLDEASRFQTQKIDTIITLLGENIKNIQEAAEITAHYLDAIERIEKKQLETDISIKLTQLGLDLDKTQTYSNLVSLVQKALDSGLFVWIDMEGSAYVDVTLDFFKRIRSEYQNVGLAMQTYLYRTEADLKQLIDLSPAIRLVKGAYAESPEVAWPKKSDVDDNYLKLSLEFLDKEYLAQGARGAFGTHDEKMIEKITHAARARQVKPAAYEFQMLYGIGRDLQTRLAREGYRIKVLISYGEAWFPWYMRRLAERPANLWFVLRNFFS